MVGRNIAIDAKRRKSKEQELPDEEAISDLGDAEADMADRLDDAHYRDDILRLLFVCCHPILPANQQIALALRVVSGLSVKEIARAFLVGESAMEQRITRAKRRVGEANVAFEAPGAVERSERLAAVAAMIYLLFNEGYSASGGKAHVRAPLCDEAIRLSRLAAQAVSERARDHGAHGAADAAACAHGGASRRGRRHRAARGSGPSLWNKAMIAEGAALIDKAMRHQRPGAYQIQAAIAALHAEAAKPEDTDWAADQSPL